MAKTRNLKFNETIKVYRSVTRETFDNFITSVNRRVALSTTLRLPFTATGANEFMRINLQTFDVFSSRFFPIHRDVPGVPFVRRGPTVGHRYP